MDATGPETAATKSSSMTVGELPLWQAIFDLRTKTGDVEKRFISERDLPACVIRDGDRLIGVLSRKSLLAELSKPMARDIYIKRSVDQLLGAMDTAPLILPATTSVAAAVGAALSRPNERSYEPVLIDIGVALNILEVDVLMLAQSTMLESAIAEKDNLITEVQRTANELRVALENLEQARDRLVQSEKMAALGQLVAGVAHEINTPVGVALTAATYLGERTAAFEQIFLENRMKRSDLQSYVDLARESAELLRYNIDRAAQLIQSFKQVAVDQTNEQRRTFDLRSYLEQLSTSVAPELRKAGHVLTVSCDDGIEVTSYPGALAQVVTNLVANASTHAYDKGAAGTIAVAASSDGSEVALSVTDDGYGMDQDTLSKIYDPFFTTKRGSGGTGLGLHIVFNIVTDTLKGNIHCRSAPGLGTCFTITIPRCGAE